MRYLILVLLMGCTTPPTPRLVPNTDRPSVLIAPCEEQKRAVAEWNLKHPDQPKQVLC